MTNKQYCLTNSELRQLQLVLLEMLLEIDRICKKNNIRYCIIAGTLLGAVRHKGFIPWDDDLDVAMTRDEYERFRETCKTELNTDKFFFQDNTTDPHYPWGYGRLRRLESEFIRVGQEHLEMKTGIFLDVFPIDNVPDFPPVRGLFAAYCFFLRKVLYSQAGAVSEKNKIKRAFYRLLRNIPLVWVFKRLDRLHNNGRGGHGGHGGHGGRGRETRYARILTFPTPKGRPYGYLRKWYTDLSTIEFEGKTFPCVRNWDEYLMYKFGDYMSLPPPEQRYCHPVSKFKLPER